MASDGDHFQQFVARGVSFAEAGRPSLVPLSTTRSRLAEDPSRPRELLQKVSVERAFGRFVLSVEYTRSEDWHLLGAERALVGAGWVDTISADRASNRHRVHAQTRYTWGREHLSAHYEWMSAHDNTDGPFSFAEQAGNLAAEWAPSAGIAAHHVSVVGTFVLPGSVTVNVSQSWRSSSPYNITTGLDASGNGLLVDRGGRSRNSGEGPGYNLLSLYAYRRVTLPHSRGRLHLNVGVQADNILDNRNYISVGSVAGSSTFGRPLAALPGRSVKVYLNVD